MKSKTQLLCCTQSNFTTAHIATSHPQPAQIATSQTSIITNHDLTTAHHSYTVHHIRNKTKIETSQTSIIANCDITPSHHSYSSHSQHWGITKEHHHNLWLHNCTPYLYITYATRPRLRLHKQASSQIVISHLHTIAIHHTCITEASQMSIVPNHVFTTAHHSYTSHPQQD